MITTFNTLKIKQKIYQNVCLDFGGKTLLQRQLFIL